MEVPQNGWFIVEKANLKWMITRGTPISGNLHMNTLDTASTRKKTWAGKVENGTF